VLGVRNSAADALSRRSATEEDLENRLKEVEIDDFINAELSYIRV
jgi:SOS response regulatory protein OraA/RecX